jgi:1,4-dihydroxy-2-naphthoate octaprenyltransferase
MLAQIASNFGNEYYDFKNGVDKKGREGFRRGVTEGEISPKSMKFATFFTLALAGVVGCMMLFYGPWWLVIVGVVIMLFALAYSTGPYPLSHHGLGDVAVVLFFGVVPVVFTCFLQTESWEGLQFVLPTSITIGLLAANVLIVNNYRDMQDDAAVNKRTTVVIYGRKTMARVYLFSGIIGMLLVSPLWLSLPVWTLLTPILYMVLHINTWRQLKNAVGAQLNPLLGKTAINLLVFAVLLLVSVCL